MTTTAFPPIDFFPLPEARSKQTKSLEFVQRAVDKDYRDIIIAAPTGIGKTAVGVALCLWASQLSREGYKPGGYYLVTQKLLQDQLERDFPRYLEEYRHSGCLLKSSIEYECPRYTTCMAGSRMPEHLECQSRKSGLCTYKLQKKAFVRAPVAVTNYPYFFTEHTYVKQLQPRNVLIADEAHTLEKQILSFVDIHISIDTLEEWTPFLRPVPVLETVEEFAAWLRAKYMGAVQDRVTDLHERMIENPKDIKLQTDFNKVENHLNKVKAAVGDMLSAPDNWIYWQEEKDGELESIAKPLYAHRFTEFLLLSSAHTRIYMSAYPGPKDVFCRNLGIDPANAARLDLTSTFPVEHRPIHMVFCGSMGRQNIDDTTPRLLRMIDKIMAAHPKEKGLIHTWSYKLGDVIYKYLKSTAHAGRIVYPTKADDREEAFKKHRQTSAPTVLISPSMTEGFSFDDDLARWQIIAKVPYPSLGDRQVVAKKDIDPEWYTLQTVSSIIQTCGRIVRSDEDSGITYVLDSDFKMLFEKSPDFFPRWFSDAFVWH